MELKEEFEFHKVHGVPCIVWQWLDSESVSKSERTKRTRKKESVGKEYQDTPMLDMRSYKNSLEYCDIVVILSDIENFKRSLRFHYNILSDPKKVNSARKYEISIDSVQVGYFTLFEKTEKCLIQPLDNKEDYLLRLLKELPRIFKLQQNLAASMEVSDDDFTTSILDNSPAASHRTRKILPTTSVNSSPAPAEISAHSISVSSQCDVIILNPVLCYIRHGMSVGVPSLIKKAVLSFYSEKEIASAKDLLFSKCEPSVIGGFKRRVNTVTRTDTEANVDDIIDALRLLDKSDCCPIFAVSSRNLMRCPRSPPEELNDISVVDRINQLEYAVSSLKNTFEITRCSCPKVSHPNTVVNNSVGEENRPGGPLPNHESSANVAVTTSTTGPGDKTSLPVGAGSPRTNSLSVAVHHASSPVASTSAIPVQSHATSSSGAKSSSSAGAGSSSSSGEMGSQATSSSPSYSEVVKRDLSPRSSMNDKRPQPNKTNMLKSSNAKKKDVKRKYGGITGVNHHEKVKSAPEPSRSILLQRLHQDTHLDDLTDMIASNFEIRKLVLVSKEEAPFKSYRLDIPMGQLDSAFNADKWPSGICVKPFYWVKKK